MILVPKEILQAKENSLDETQQKEMKWAKNKYNDTEQCRNGMWSDLGGGDVRVDLLNTLVSR